MSCLFDSFSSYLKNVYDVQASSHDIRQNICNYMSLDPSFGKDEPRLSEYMQWIGRGLDEYVKEMRLSSTWGGATEIMIFSELYCARVICFDIRPGGKRMVYEPSRRMPPLFNVAITWNGGHFEPLLTYKSHDSRGIKLKTMNRVTAIRTHQYFKT